MFLLIYYTYHTGLLNRQLKKYHNLADSQLPVSKVYLGQPSCFSSLLKQTTNMLDGDRREYLRFNYSKDGGAAHQ